MKKNFDPVTVDILTEVCGEEAKVGDGGQEEPEGVLLLRGDAQHVHGPAHPPPVLQRSHNLNLVL